MKPAQAPIYRATERLLLWAIPITERLPKSLPYQTLGGLMIRDIRECLDAVILAVQSEGRERLGCIDILIARMTAVKTTIRMFAELRRQIPDEARKPTPKVADTTMQPGTKVEAKKSPREELAYHHIISPKQHSQFLDLINLIAAQAGAWRNKTVADINAHD